MLDYMIPVQASEFAKQVDLLVLALTILGVVFTLLVTVACVVLAIKYRKGNPVDRNLEHPDSNVLEITWTVIPTILALIIFVWGTELFFEFKEVPADALEIQVVGKQWMWKIQHGNGRREVNELHVPAGQPIKLTMTSQDVIHSFFLPEFRVKQDVLPGRYTQMWFTPNKDKTGIYKIFCAEYCGTDHSRMKGTIFVMDPADYQKWLTTGNIASTPASAGEQLFTRLGCLACHNETAGARGPNLAGKFGMEEIVVEGGAEKTVTVNEEYITESLQNPGQKLVKGFTPLMPSFAGQLSQDDVSNIIAYIKSLQ